MLRGSDRWSFVAERPRPGEGRAKAAATRTAAALAVTPFSAAGGGQGVNIAGGEWDCSVVWLLPGTGEKRQKLLMGRAGKRRVDGWTMAVDPIPQPVAAD
jgi:hypothetical protein